MNRTVKYLWIFVLGLTSLSSAVTSDELKSALASYRDEAKGRIGDPIGSGILYDLVAPLSGIERFDGTVAAPAADFSTWRQIGFEIRRASLSESRIPDMQLWNEQRQDAQKRSVHPLSLLMFDYQRVSGVFDRDEVIDFENGKVRGINAAALETDRVVALGLLHEWTYRGADVEFALDDASILDNVGGVADWQLDFGDGMGFRPRSKSGMYRVSYAETGLKTITGRFETRTGEVLFGRTRIEVRSLDAPPPSTTWALTASHSTGGPAATGEAYLLYAPGHAAVERPVVLVEGLDLDNSLNWPELYDLMNQELLIESLLNLGFDAVVLNYTNSTIDIRDNGFLVQELIEELNTATGGIHPLVMVGTSLGGVTTRYALTYMEANSLPHNVSTFISVDSPQNGANIPIGIQYWADFFAGESADAAAARDALLTPAPRQLLLYHLSSSGAGVANPDPLLGAFQNNLASLGDYPAQPRLVSVINGSGTMQHSGFLPGAQIIRWVYDNIFVDIRGNVWAVSNTVNTRVLQGEINLIWPLPDTYRDVYIQPCLPWDNAPGGKTTTMAELDSTNAPYGDIQALHPAHCFIPSVSALDLSTNDPFFNIAGAPNLYDLTPFDSVYYPVLNQDHVQITPENAAWFINEILGPLGTPDLTVAVDGDSLRLRWNGVFSASGYRVYYTTDQNSWPGTYVSTNATEWTTAASDSVGYYRVAAVR